MAPNMQSDVDTVAGSVGRVGTPITLCDKNLLVHELPFLLDMPPNVVVTPFPEICPSQEVDRTGCFLGFDAGTSKSRHVVSLGRLRDIRFMSIFRFKVWWTTHWVGSKGSDLETETQVLLLDTPRKAASLNICPHPYVLILPLIEGKFRASLQPGDDDNIDACVESCSDAVEASSFRSCVYLHAGWDPYDLMKDAMRAVRSHLGTFRLLEEKTPPGIIDKFGWCTWDAFYLTVHPEGVWQGVKRLVDGGCPPGLVVIDDGWQSISHDSDPSKEAMALTVAGEQMPCRLTRFQENSKFSDYVRRDLLPKGSKTASRGMGAFIHDLKSEFQTLEYVYVWHAFCGYWGGLRPGTTDLPSRVITPRLSPGLQKTMEDLAVDKIVRHGVGLVPPERVRELYDAMHSYLANAGIDGVKVDVIHVLEMICEEFGGRVELAKAYFRALSASVKKYFNGNGVIASMEHCNDFMYLGTEQICLGRVGDDFWCTDALWLQGCHMVHCAYNSLWMGQVIHPDWDMFQSTHPCAAFHAASRAISGGPIYVSDAVGDHDFGVLRRLVLPDGSILRCARYALPTRDCLFEDPLHDGSTMLKIWNLNKHGGVVGAFNCQGGGWCREERRNKCAPELSKRVESRVGARDVEWSEGSIPSLVADAVQEFCVYLCGSGRMLLIKHTDDIHVSLDPFNFEILTITPVRRISATHKFCAVGLTNMLNPGGAIERVHADAVSAEVEIKGCGQMWAYASHRPQLCKLNGADVDFSYHSEDGTLVVQIPWIGGSHSILQYFF